VSGADRSLKLGLKLPGETGPSGGPAMTDVLGICTAWGDGVCVVDSGGRIQRYNAALVEHLDELVVKAVNESGGYGMLIGPHAPKADHEEYRRRIQADPRGYIAQPTIALSRHPSWSQGSLEGRHVDLRPYVLFGKEIRVTPGGLTRVALRAGSLPHAAPPSSVAVTS
jgi:hypothetical protein